MNRMTKEIMVTVSGIQFEIEASEPVELITMGSYYNKNGKHYILYDESDMEDGGLTKNRIKIDPNKVEVFKSGATNAQMIFEEGKTNLTYYDTVMGSLLMGVTTESIRIREEEDKIRAKVRYSLEVNYTHISDCEIVIEAKSKRIKSN
ncbi:MAG: DUF1934 domain-containing protein [Lachnospiraceae bacterium]|nr:DUF1934 domain-containing protein [Lachnospiraceae bacterium]